jgi:hypothetical protein
MNCILLTAGGGGGSGAYSPPEDTTLLDLSAEQWSDLFTLFVKDLTGSTDSAAEDAELVDSDDEEAVAAAAAAKKAAAAVLPAAVRCPCWQGQGVESLRC